MKKPNPLQHLVVLSVDATAAVFLFQVVALLLSRFRFLPLFPGLWAVWTVYYTVAYCVFGQTLGEAFFRSGLAAEQRNVPVTIRILLRETLTSLPAVLFWATCRPRLLLSHSFFIVSGWIILRCFRKRLFGLAVRRTRERPAFKPWRIYLILILAGAAARLFHTVTTNDGTRLSESPLYAAPRPTVRSVRNYVRFLQENRQNIPDYVMGLFDEYDHVILCERHHREMTQYDMIYRLVTDRRFTERVGVVFTEIGCAESRNGYKKFVDTDFPDDDAVERGLASFLTENQSVHLLWPNTNWFDFLKRMYYFNHGKQRRVEILFADRNWIDRSRLHVRDSIMAGNILSTIETEGIRKSLVIMNYRHAYLTPGNCGHYIGRRFPGKTAVVLIHFAAPDLISVLRGKEAVKPIRHGTWDVAFEQMPDDEFAFDFEDSPFGNDPFDHFVLPWSRERGLRYRDMFTGLIYYKAPTEQYTSVGFPHLFDTDNVGALEERERLMPGYSLKYWEFLKEGPVVVDGREIYEASNRTANLRFFGLFVFSLLLDGMLYLFLHRTQPNDRIP